MIKEGTKYDDNKEMFALIPADVMFDIAKVFTYGAIKYEPKNWEKGMSWSRVFSAVMRHLWKFWLGEQNDQESGLSHLSHAIVCCIFLLWYSKNRLNFDDRTVIANEKVAIYNGRSKSR